MNEVWEKVYKAYTFSFPLMIMDATVRVSTNTVEPGGTGKAPANRWMHAKELASASFRQVVTPNVDTIYSQIFIDLGKDALVLYKPAVSRKNSVPSEDMCAHHPYPRRFPGRPQCLTTHP